MIKKFNAYEAVEFIETRLQFCVRLRNGELTEEQSDWCVDNVGIITPYTYDNGFTMDTTAEFDWCVVYSDDHGYKVLFKNGSDAVLFKLRFG